MINRSREGEERGQGVPRSEEEREERHQQLYPGEPLPPRGSGLSGIGQTTTTNYAPAVISGLFALGAALILAMAIKKGA